MCLMSSRTFSPVHECAPPCWSLPGRLLSAYDALAFAKTNLERYPSAAVAVVTGTYLEGLLGALLDERQCTAVGPYGFREWLYGA